MNNRDSGPGFFGVIEALLAIVGALTVMGVVAVAASVIAFGLNYWLLARMDASAMLMMGVAEVPIAVLLGAAFLHERLPAGTFAGGVCVLVAVVTSLVGDARDRRSQ